MGKTSIQWTEHSINPIRARNKATGQVGHYCEKVSAGCKNCYASRLQSRFGLPEFGAGQHRDDVEVFLDEGKLAEVERRKKPTVYFWCDMTDMFGDWVPIEWIEKCFATMAKTPQHTHQVLTKRTERMAMHLSHPGMPLAINKLVGGTIYEEPLRFQWPLPNVWVGTSTEDQAAADERIPHLLRVPAAVRFLSVEPLLGPVDLRCVQTIDKMVEIDALTGDHGVYRPLAGRSDARISWVIIGGESGPNSRPCHLEWIRPIIQQCQATGTPVFLKQVGASAWSATKADHLGRIAADSPMGSEPVANEPWRLWLKDRKGGNMEEWPADLRVREFPV